MTRTNSRKMLWLGLLMGLLVATPAGATTDYGTFVGSNFTFVGPPTCFPCGVRETSTFGDPEPLFGAPIVAGDSLLFFPSNFSASGAGGGFDQTGAQLQAEIIATGAAPIDKIIIQEFGDFLLGGVGTAATGLFLQMSGFVTVTEVGGVPVAPVVIPWLGTFNPGDTLDLVSNPGFAIWSASVVIDVQSVVANATKATLSYDDNLMAFSEVGTTAFVQKKVVPGPSVIITVPEPGTAALFCAGLLGLVARARRRGAR